MKAKRITMSAVIAALALAALAAGLLWTFGPWEGPALSTAPTAAPTDVPATPATVPTASPSPASPDTPTAAPPTTIPESIEAQTRFWDLLVEYPYVIAEVLEVTDQPLEQKGFTYTRVDCRVVYGYRTWDDLLSPALKAPMEFQLYLTAGALEMLGQADMLLCQPESLYGDPCYTADQIIPIVDGRLVLENGELDVGKLEVVNTEVKRIIEKRANGGELLAREKLAPEAPLENGSTVEEAVAFFDAWKQSFDQMIADAPAGGIIIEPPLIAMTCSDPFMIVEVLKRTDETLEERLTEYTRVDCRVTYGYRTADSLLSPAIKAPMDVKLYLSAELLEQLDQVDCFLCVPRNLTWECYKTDYIIPIVDGRLALEDDPKGIDPLRPFNEHIKSLLEWQSKGNKLSKAQRLAPKAPLENGAAVEEVIAYFDAWEVYYEQVMRDDQYRRATLERYGF